MTAAWTWEQSLVRRLRRNHLLTRAPAHAATDVARAVCGMQAQIPAAADLSIGIRTEGLSRSALHSLVIEGHALIRTYAMRGTAHLLPCDDIPLYLAAMRQLHGGDDRWYTAFGLGADEAQRLFSLLATILDGRTLDRQALVDALRRHPWVFDIFDPTLADLVVVAAYAGVLAYGPMSGRTSTFVRPDQWCPRWYRADGDVALRELVRRYIAAYGPATHRDMARWLGTTARIAQQLMISLGDDLSPVNIAGQPAWLLTADADSCTDFKDKPKGVRLLPQYDCYVLGSGLRDRIVSDDARNLVRQRKRGRYEGAAGLPVLLIDGVVGGVWQRRTSAGQLHITVEPVRPLTRWQRTALEDEAHRVAGFFEAKLTLAIAR
jgi:hypothetical protein